jgi:predicted DNA-binding transcriptional regulator YafY
MIYIVCDRRNNTYSIDNESDIGSNELRDWMLDALCINSLVKESTGLRDRIIFENVPSGHQFLTKLIQAIRDNRKVRVTYKGYTMSQEMTYELEPYFIREFKRRWYLYAHKDYDKDHEPHMYALDRMSEMEILTETFEIPKDIVAEEWFSPLYGVRKYPDMKRERVVLKVYGKQVQFFRSLPLHHSQEEIESQEGFSIFTYHLAPDYDFRQDILSFGDKVEVLKPEELRNNFIEMINNLNIRYNGRRNENENH